MFLHERVKPKRHKGNVMPGFFAQPKYDGYRATLFIDGVKPVMYGREARPDLEFLERFPRLLDLPELKAFMKNAPPRSSLDGELITVGHATDVPSALRDTNLSLRFVPFAIPWWDGRDLEDKPLDKVADDFRGQGFDIDPGTLIHEETSQDQLLRMARNLGLEGYVIKQYNYQGWTKLKQQCTVDCVVTDLVPGLGKYAGQTGSLTVSLLKDGKFVVVANVSGMDDETRRLITSQDLGRVVEVEYQELGSRGKLRHPRFVRWRDDKPAGECEWSQVCE